MARKKQPPAPRNTDPSNYLYYDRDNNICWLIQPPLCEIHEENTGLTDGTMDYIRRSLNKWKDAGITTFIADDSPLGDFITGENLTEFTERALAVAIKPNCTKGEMWDFMYSPDRYLFDVNDDLCDDAEIMAVMSYSPSMGTQYTMDYNIVNKKYRGKGLGTAMLKSFIENPEFFTGREKIKAINATVREDNVASIKSLMKNGLTVVPGSHRQFGIANGKRYYIYQRILNESMSR